MRRAIEPMLAGTALGEVPEGDIQYLIDLGLCRMASGQSLTIANPICRAVLPRALAFTSQASLPQIAPTWLNPDGGLNPERLLAALLQLWRQPGIGATGRLPGRAGAGRRLAGDLRPPLGTAADPRAHVQRRDAKPPGTKD